MADQLTDDKFYVFNQALSSFDKNGYGSITAEELQIAMTSLGQDPTEAKFQDMINEVDNEGNGTIKLTKLLILMASELRDTGAFRLLMDMDMDSALGKIPKTSFHAMACTSHPQVFQVNGKVQNKEVTILIDSGSTYNFINQDVANKLSLPIVRDINFQVTVANGETIECIGRCLGVTLMIQGYLVQTDFYVLPNVSCEVVLGVQWLETLGPIWVDYRQLIMKFTHLEQSHTIQGLQQSDFEEELMQLSGMGGFFSHMGVLAGHVVV